MPVAGAAGPITVAGSLVQNTAESLALNAMRLAIDDMTCGITPTSTIMDMKCTSHRQSGPDLLLHIIAGSQMHEYLFGVRPTVSMLGVAGQTVSAQSVYEKALSMTFSILAGQRKLGIGCLAFSDVGSPVQLTLDYELGMYFRNLFRDVNVDDEHIGIDTIFATASRGGFFLETEHTANFFREECWFPAFIDNRLPLAWANSPTDMIDNARNRTSQLYEKAENKCPLSAGQKQEIVELIKQADIAVAS
jgi:trimethylamine--corrinoid protein Co-methyltransferase